MVPSVRLAWGICMHLKHCIGKWELCNVKGVSTLMPFFFFFFLLLAYYDVLRFTDTPRVDLETRLSNFNQIILTKWTNGLKCFLQYNRIVDNRGNSSTQRQEEKLYYFFYSWNKLFASHIERLKQQWFNYIWPDNFPNYQHYIKYKFISIVINVD